jgi:hypothetical protein
VRAAPALEGAVDEAVVAVDADDPDDRRDRLGHRAQGGGLALQRALVADLRRDVAHHRRVVLDAAGLVAVREHHVADRDGLALVVVDHRVADPDAVRLHGRHDDPGEQLVGLGRVEVAEVAVRDRLVGAKSGDPARRQVHVGDAAARIGLHDVIGRRLEDRA